MTQIGFEHRMRDPSTHVLRKKVIWTLAHGDDFMSSASRAAATWLKAQGFAGAKVRDQLEKLARALSHAPREGRAKAGLSVSVLAVPGESRPSPEEGRPRGSARQSTPTGRRVYCGMVRRHFGIKHICPSWKHNNNNNDNNKSNNVYTYTKYC